MFAAGGKLKHGYNGRGTLHDLLSTIMHFSLNFDSIVWSHIRRDGNSVAHFLASVRPALPSLMLFLDELPSDIFVLLTKDNE